VVCFSISRRKTVFGDTVFFLLTSENFCGIMALQMEDGRQPRLFAKGEAIKVLPYFYA
jgi:hypothetical protein